MLSWWSKLAMDVNLRWSSMRQTAFSWQIPAIKVCVFNDAYN